MRTVGETAGAEVGTPTARPGQVEHLSVGRRAERGKAARAGVPRSSLATWEPVRGRRSPTELLEEQAASRVPELVPIRYGRMLVSPFAFYRGAALLMAADLAALPRTGLDAQLCGDAHLSNFGLFAAPDRRLVFSINDFDETLPGPFEWDLRRLVASFAVAGRDRGFSDRERRTANRAVGRGYREAMTRYAGLRNLDVWYLRLDVEQVAPQISKHWTPRETKAYDRLVAKSRRRTSLKALAKLTEVADGQRRIISDPPVVVPIEEIAGERADDLGAFLNGVARSYRRTLSGDRRKLLERYHYVHAARKVVGVGSVGTRAYILLTLGRGDDDPLFLQIKEAEASVLEPFLGPSEFQNHGQRVVEGQRLTQAASDIMLGWTRMRDPADVARDYYVRQLWDAKGSADVELMTPGVLTDYAELCGTELARSHARGGGDAVAIAAYLGKSDAVDRALAEFAEVYADQNERDYQTLADAVKSGRIKATTGV